jgi:hypothetical protein
VKPDRRGSQHRQPNRLTRHAVHFINWFFAIQPRMRSAICTLFEAALGKLQRRASQKLVDPKRIG